MKVALAAICTVIFVIGIWTKEDLIVGLSILMVAVFTLGFVLSGPVPEHMETYRPILSSTLHGDKITFTIKDEDGLLKPITVRQMHVAIRGNHDDKIDNLTGLDLRVDRKGNDILVIVRDKEGL